MGRAGDQVPGEAHVLFVGGAEQGENQAQEALPVDRQAVEDAQLNEEKKVKCVRSIDRIKLTIEQ